MRVLLVLVFVTYFKLSFAEYKVPDALVEVLRPRGLRVSIPDEEGIKLFAFHGQVNKEMNGREGGTFSRDITKPKGGRWTFYDPYAELKVGDTLYYWTYVDYFDGRNKLGYTNDDNTFVVKELIDKEVTSAPPIDVRQPEVTLPSGCKFGGTISKNKQVCSEQLIFHDNFTSLHKSLWTPEVKFAGAPDYEFVVYTKDPKNLKAKNGHLKIRPVLSEELFGENFVTSTDEVDLGTNCTGVPGTLDCVQKSVAFLILPPVASAQITTKNKWSFKFGKIEIRAKLPKGDWIYPELYLNPVTEDYGPGYASGQIRIAFLPGNDKLNKNLQGGCILGSSSGGRNYAMKTIRKNRGSWSDGFHKFTVVWRPDEITLSVDDVVYGNVYPPKGGFASEAQNLNLEDAEKWHEGTSFAPFDKEMYLVIGVGVGGQTFNDRSDGTKPWQNSDAKSQKKFYAAKSNWYQSWSDASGLEVDDVKVWSL